MITTRRWVYLLSLLLAASIACGPLGGQTPPKPTPLPPTAGPTPAPAGAALADLETAYYTNHHEEGLAAANQVLAQDPNNATVLALRAGFNSRTDSDSANADITRALELDPDNAYAHAMRSLYILLNDGELDAAKAEIDRALAINPELPLAYATLAFILELQGDSEGSIAANDRAIELRPDYASAIRNRGLRALANGDLEAALADFNRAIEIGADPDAYDGRASVYQTQGNYEAALADHNRAIELRPSDDTYYYNRGYTYLYLNDIDAGIEDFTRAIELNDQAVYRDVRAFMYYQVGDFDATQADAHQAAALSEGDPTYNNNAAYLLALMDRDLVQAAQYIEVTLAAAPDEPGYLDTQAYIYYRQGNYAEAREMFTRLVEDGFTSSYYGLGLVQQAQGENAAAADSFRAFLEEYPEDLVSEDARERLESLGG